MWIKYKNIKYHGFQKVKEPSLIYYLGLVNVAIAVVIIKSIEKV